MTVRPVLRWHGGKWLLAPWIIDHFPDHRIYVEPFGGAASVLLRKPRAYAEIYNDLDQDVVNLFRVLRSDDAGRLIEKVRLMPFSRTEFDAAYGEAETPIDQAVSTIVRSFMGFGSDAALGRATGFRAVSNRSGTSPAHDWKNYPDCLQMIIDRLSGVVIENRAALDVMRANDGPDTLHYVDPPYLHDTRAHSSGKNYRHEMSDDDHLVMLDFLSSLKGKVVLSGYPSETYDTFLRDWIRVERKALADGAAERTEVLWMNFDAAPDLWSVVS